jgi:single stranded DNA-binding protein
MTFFNRVILTGKVATPPRRHYRPDGSPVVQFPLELDDDKSFAGQTEHRSGKEKEGRSFIDVVAFGELAEFKPDLLQSGQHLWVSGRLNLRHWKTPEGKKQTRTEVIATDLRRAEDLNLTNVCPACGRQGTKKWA